MVIFHIISEGFSLGKANSSTINPNPLSTRVRCERFSHKNSVQIARNTNCPVNKPQTQTLHKIRFLGLGKRTLGKALIKSFKVLRTVSAFFDVHNRFV